jgi:MSHA pilin protein MshC
MNGLNKMRGTLNNLQFVGDAQNKPSGEAFFVGASLLAKRFRQQACPELVEVAGSYNFERLNKMRGFTLVELITVMVIVGILAVSVLPRFFTVSDFEDRGSADQVKSMLRFAQKTAIAQHRNISVAISTATTPNCTTTLAGAALTCQVKSTVAAKTVTFDALGRPVPNAADAVTVGGTVITIEAETGYVH